MSLQTISWASSKDRACLARSLAEGQISVGSSDTVLGFLAPLTLAGFQKLDSIKKRADKPYLILIGDQSKISSFTDQPISPHLEQLMDLCWPGPVTLIFKAKEDLPEFIKSAQSTVALRVPDHKGLLALLKELPGLFSTSANLHGKPVPESIGQIDPEILKAVKYVMIDDHATAPNISADLQGKSYRRMLPSTILDCTGKEIRIVREGACPIDKLEAAYGQKFLKPLT